MFLHTSYEVPTVRDLRDAVDTVSRAERSRRHSLSSPVNAPPSTGHADQDIVESRSVDRTAAQQHPNAQSERRPITPSHDQQQRPLSCKYGLVGVNLVISHGTVCLALSPPFGQSLQPLQPAPRVTGCTTTAQQTVRLEVVRSTWRRRSTACYVSRMAMARVVAKSSIRDITHLQHMQWLSSPRTEDGVLVRIGPPKYPASVGVCQYYWRLPKAGASDGSQHA